MPTTFIAINVNMSLHISQTIISLSVMGSAISVLRQVWTCNLANCSLCPYAIYSLVVLNFTFCSDYYSDYG